jgi:hypothetical protein
MSFLCYLCLFAHSGVQHILCCVFVLFFFVLCDLCCQVYLADPILIAPSAKTKNKGVYSLFSLTTILMFDCLIVFNATFNNSSAISWRSVLLVEETGKPGENHRPVASH